MKQKKTLMPFLIEDDNRIKLKISSAYEKRAMADIVNDLIRKMPISKNESAGVRK